MKNKATEPLTIEKLRMITGDNYTDEEAEKIVDFIKRYAAIVARHAAIGDNSSFFVQNKTSRLF